MAGSKYCLTKMKNSKNIWKCPQKRFYFVVLNKYHADTKVKYIFHTHSYKIKKLI